MSTAARPLVILVANNPYGHHLLASQLVDVYRSIRPSARVMLVCNGQMEHVTPVRDDDLTVVSFATRKGGAFSYLRLLWVLLSLRRRFPDAAYHLRGFVCGFVFAVSRLGRLEHDRYLYDPRGAFFMEWAEAGRFGRLSGFFRAVEGRLVKGAFATIVTSTKFGALYRGLFGSTNNLVTVYNATSFSLEPGPGVPSEGPVRLVYLGTFNYWHDIDEVVRVMADAARQIGPERTELYVFTSAQFHNLVLERLAAVDCASVDVRYVPYHDIPMALANKHIGVSVVRPTPSTRIASPIKIADYVSHGLVPLLNRGIGDFDDHYLTHSSAVLYDFGEAIDLSEVESIRTGPNKVIYDKVSIEQASSKLAPLVDRMVS